MSGGYFALAPRPLVTEDAAGAHQLLISRLGMTPYLDRAVEVLSVAERGGDAEHRAMVVARDKTVAGLGLFGFIAGTEAAFRLHTLVVESTANDYAERLLDAIIDAVREGGGRLIIAELADEPANAATITLLRRERFIEAGRIADYFRDGVPLVILRRDLF